VDRSDLILVELEVLERLAQLGEVHAADVLALLDQGVDSVCEHVGHLSFLPPFESAGNGAVTPGRYRETLLHWIKEECHEEPSHEE
jgi:hypothetical protein